MSRKRNSSPLYLIIYRDVKQRIISGQYRPGEKIPAIRVIADDFGCNKLTVQKAYERLEQDGLIEKRVGSGSFVRFPERIRSFGSRYDFKTDYPAESFFPYEKVQKVINDLFHMERHHTLAPAPAGGDQELIDILSRYYHLPADRMLMISGSQQGLDLIAKVFSAGISESILFEDPTYSVAISLFKARHFVFLDSDGPDIDILDRKLSPQIRLFYTMPAVHNPTGIAYSREKKDAVAQRAVGHPFYIIEDDYLGEFRRSPGFRFIDICPDRTLYIKSLSQTTVAGIRLGFMVVPEDLYDKFVYAKYSSDIASNGLIQKMMREFIKQGHYQAHLDWIKGQVHQRRLRMLELIGRFGFLSVPNEQAGYSLWVKDGQARKWTGVPWTMGREFSFSSIYRNFFRLSFMNMNDDAFNDGLEYLEMIFRDSTY